MMICEYTIDMFFDTGYLEDHPALYEVTFGSDPVASHPDGPSGTTYTTAAAKFVSMQLGGLKLTREQIETMIGSHKLSVQEERAGDHFAQNAWQYQ